MYIVSQTREFKDWVDGLRDRKAALRIDRQLLKMESGLLGDWKSLGGGISEIRIDYGPGYRLYYTVRKRQKGAEKDDFESQGYSEENLNQWFDCLGKVEPWEY